MPGAGPPMVPAAYGATYPGIHLGQPVEKPWAVLEAKGTFVRFQRKRLNFLPVVTCTALPCAMFGMVAWALSSTLHYEQPDVCFLVVLVGFLATAGIGAYSAWQRAYKVGEREPSWLIFLAISLFIAFTAGVIAGESNYAKNIQPYLEMTNLNTYTNVSPARMRGQQLMDAGSLTWASGTKLDLSKSMGFKNLHTYCVAPIVEGDIPLATYDFWAVGTNCCSGNMADFHCEGFNDPRPHGGLRLMNDDERAYYRLAVQQAEAAYNIRAVHPLFFTWVPAESTGAANPVAQQVEGWRQAGRDALIMGMLGHLLFQALAVAVATVTFAKLGSL